MNDYRYGFNGKEKDVDGEWGENTANYDYGFRIYNPSVGKFLSVDPLMGKYPMLTPYQFASNSPVANIDLDGLESFFAADGSFIGKFGESTEIRIITNRTAEIVASEGAKNIAKNMHLVPYLEGKSQKAYTNQDQLAQDWAYEYNPKTHLENTIANGGSDFLSDKGYDAKEWGARIGSKEVKGEDGKNVVLYILGTSVDGVKGGVSLNLSRLIDGWKFNAGVHTHSIRGSDENGEGFSGYRNDLGQPGGEALVKVNMIKKLYIYRHLILN